MKILEKYTGERVYMFPNGAIATPAIIKEKYPATEVFTHIIETDESSQVCFAIQNLAAMRSFYNVDSSLTEDEAIVKIEEIVNTEPEVEPSAEERIAAALEYQNMASMEDVNGEVTK